MADANVSLQNVATNDLRKTTSDSEGNYIFAQLPVGTYLLSVEKPGFQRFTLQDVVIQVDANGEGRGAAGWRRHSRGDRLGFGLGSESVWQPSVKSSIRVRSWSFP